MKKPLLETSQLYRISADELPISGDALLDLMQAVFNKGALIRFRAKGSSMSPFIRDGDLITVSPLFDQKLKVGEVYAFIHPGSERLVVHRVVALFDEGLMFKGDSVAAASDGLVPVINVIGKVIKVEHNGHPIGFGLGVERYLIAWLSRTGLLIHVGNGIAPFYRLFKRKNH